MAEVPLVLIAAQGVLDVAGNGGIHIFVGAFLAGKGGGLVVMDAAETHGAAVADVLIDAVDAEDIVLLETKLATPKNQVFVLQFPVGEFDMVVFDPEAGSCRIFEIKHSEEAVPQQYRHLIDDQKCAQTEHRCC